MCWVFAFIRAEIHPLLDGKFSFYKFLFTVVSFTDGYL